MKFVVQNLEDQQDCEDERSRQSRVISEEPHQLECCTQKSTCRQGRKFRFGFSEFCHDLSVRANAAALKVGGKCTDGAVIIDVADADGDRTQLTSKGADDLGCRQGMTAKVAEEVIVSRNGRNPQHGLPFAQQ